LQASTKEEQNPPKKARKQETNFTVEHCKKIPPPPQKVFSGEGKNREVVKAGSLEKKLAKKARWHDGQDENGEPVGISSGNFMIVFLHYHAILTL
jgi:hypothetical protein